MLVLAAIVVVVVKQRRVEGAGAAAAAMMVNETDLSRSVQVRTRSTHRVSSSGSLVQPSKLYIALDGSEWCSIRVRR